MKNFNLKTYLFAGIGLLAFAGSAFGGAAGSGSIGFCGGGGVIVDATHITWSPPNGSMCVRIAGKASAPLLLVGSRAIVATSRQRRIGAVVI